MTNETPIIGILSGPHKQKPFSGDKQFFENIQHECMKHGAVSFVFTPLCIQHDAIEGFLVENGKWMKKIFPYPHLVYNRLPTHSLENKKHVQAFFRTLENRNIPYFNRTFIDKWTAYAWLQNVKNALFQLPRTEPLTDTEEAVRFLKTYSFIYAKPVHGKMGKGIFTLSFHNENNILLTTHTKTKIITIDDFRKLCSNLLKKRTPYIFQQGITLDECDNQKYDFRILLIKTESEWNVIGIGVRAADKSKITTHTVRGGKLLPRERVTSVHDFEQLTMIAKQAASQLANKEKTLRECSLDIGKDLEGNYWLFEINAKPMAFDERDIETKRISELVKTFYYVINDSYGAHF